jgi:4-hydroxy-tetrahydrodipicolinate synthase
MVGLSGMFANLPTAFAEKTGELDLPTVQTRISWLLDSGVHGFSTQLSAGEFAYLAIDERRALTTAVIRAVDGSRPVLVGVSGNSLRETVLLGKHAAELGASAVMAMPRSYYKLSDDEVVGMYESIGKEVPCPVGIYNNPFSTGVDISANLYKRIENVCNVVVTKDGAGDVYRLTEIRAKRTAMSYLCGTEYLSLPSLLLGGDGCCNAINSVLPHQMLAIYRAVREGNIASALESFELMQPLFTFIRSHGVARTAKAAADLLGRSFGPHRLPLQALPTDAIGNLRRILSIV